MTIKISESALGCFPHGHLATTFLAPTTDVGTRFHLDVVIETFAVQGTALTCVGTDITYRSMHIGTAQHEVSAGLADRGAILKQSNVIGFGMLVTQIKAVKSRDLTHAMAIPAITDTLL